MELENHKINPEECLESIKIESSHQDLFDNNISDDVDLKPTVNFRDKFINILISYNKLQKRINTQNHKYSKQCHRIIDLQKKIKLLDGENQKNIYDLRINKYTLDNQKEKIFKLEKIIIYFFCLLNLLIVTQILYRLN